MSLACRILPTVAVLAWSVAFSASAPAAMLDVDRAPAVDGDPLPAKLFLTVRDNQGRAVHGAIVVLSGPAILPLPVVRTDLAGLASFSLAPGTYSVVAYYGQAAIRPEVIELAPGSETWAEVWLPLNLADFNGDGSVTSNDFFEFLQYWGDSLWEADFNRDARVDTYDFFEYMKAFLTDCTGVEEEEPAIQ